MHLQFCDFFLFVFEQNMPACCVRNCTSRSTHPKTRRKNIRHFKFPRDSDIRRKWLNACQRYESELNMDYGKLKCNKCFLFLKYDIFYIQQKLCVHEREIYQVKYILTCNL